MHVFAQLYASRDTRNVACTNDTEARGSYSRFMTNRTGREHTMKRTAIILGIAAAMGVAPSVAAAGSVTGQVVKPQLVKAQIVKAQIVKPQLVKPQLVKAQIVRPQARPTIQAAIDSRGQSVWRAGRHIMY